MVFGASMPEAPVDENGYPSSGEYDVCTAGDSCYWPVVDSEAKATGMKQAPDGQLGFCVAGTVAAHYCPDSWIAVFVGHSVISDTGGRAKDADPLFSQDENLAHSGCRLIRYLVAGRASPTGSLLTPG
ncbi:hypothetical protein BKG84_05215 [Mycobacteroides chelonae]|uniref:Uncharacterized protein n=1 Tax=Mycobacteroides chelonae TaxID=1774 RepID=A0A1S1M3T4_MYCCH|nr:hypothetical protein BKG84_05215 [Mycobacteroides chelonae]